MEMTTKADSTMIIQALSVNGVACLAVESRLDDSDGALSVIVDDSNTD